MKSSGGGVGEDKSPDKEPKKKERSGGSIKKRLSIGYGFSSLRKRNPIKGVFEEDDRKKGKSIEIKVDDVGWKQTKHVGQEEAQQLKALMVLTKQLGEEDTDEIAQLLQEWDADKVQKEIEDKRRMQMQKNRSLQVVMEQWGRSGPERDAFPLPSDADGALSLSSPSAITLPAPGPAPATPIPPTPGDSAADTLTSTSTIATLTSSAATLNSSAGAPNNNADATAEQDQLKKEVSPSSSPMMMMMTSAAEDNKSSHYDGYDGRRRGSSFDDSSPTWSVDDEYTADSSVIIEDDDEDLMEVPEIGSEGNDSEGSEGAGGGRSPRTSSSSAKKKKKIREPRPPSMVFGKKENLDLRDWQTFLEAERARALPYAVNSPRRAASPRNSPRNSPAGFLIFKQKKMLTTLNSTNNSGQASPSSKLGSGGRHPTRPRSGGGGDDVSSDVRGAAMCRQNGGGRAWSDDESSSYEQRRPGDGGRGDIGDEVVELAEMSEGEETEGETFSHRRDSTSSARMSPTPSTSTPTTPTKAGSPTIPKIVLTPQMQERTVKLPPPAAQSPTSPSRNGGADVSSASSSATSAATSTSPGRTSRRKAAGEQIRRISLSDSQLVFFQRWMRDKVKDGKVEVPADVEQEIRERERDAVRRYDKMEADGLRKALVKRDKELAVLRRAVEELKGREEKAAARERELRDEIRRERERADRVQARENVLKEMIREKVEEKRKMKEERERELELRRVSSSDDQHQHQHQHQPPRRATKENKKEKKEKEKEKGKSEKKRRGSAIKFVSKEKGERERSSRAGGRLDSSGERAPEPIQHAAGVVGSAGSDEVTSLQELVKGAGTWSKSRGREVKIFKHLRSKSSEEVPTAYVAKESREAH